MKKLASTIILGVIFFGIPVLAHAGEAAIDQAYTRLEENVFAFEVPSSWSRLKGEKLERFRQQQAKALRNLAKDMPLLDEEALKKFLYVAKFSAPGQDAFIVAVAVQISPQGEDFLDKQYESYTKRLQYFIDQGKIRKVWRKEKKTIGGIPALVLELEFAGGARTISCYFYSPLHPTLSISLVMDSAPGRFSAYQQDFDHLLSTLRINFPQ